MPAYKDIFYDSKDGLKLYARDYEKADAPLTVLCLHGLTRNSADFENLAGHLGKKYRVVAVDQRGRGRSARDPDAANYQIGTYVRDMFTLLDKLGIDRVVLIGTSMGGLMSMIMCATHPQRISGVVINDIGPVVDPRGLARILRYTGKTKPVSDWPEAAARIEELNGAFFPGFGPDDWMRFARRTYREDQNGVPVLDYDPAIATPLNSNQDGAASPDLWPAFEATRGRPLLLIRGDLSDVLSLETAAEMCARHDDCCLVTVRDRGHAPSLDEAPAVDAIDSLLSGLAG